MLNQNTKLLIEGNALENVICKMSCHLVYLVLMRKHDKRWRCIVASYIAINSHDVFNIRYAEHLIVSWHIINEPCHMTSVAVLDSLLGDHNCTVRYTYRTYCYITVSCSYQFVESNVGPFIIGSDMLSAKQPSHYLNQWWRCFVGSVTCHVVVIYSSVSKVLLSQIQFYLKYGH